MSPVELEERTDVTFEFIEVCALDLVSEDARTDVTSQTTNVLI